ncbi:MAG: hypothetical protein KC619_22975 [Myxococcales bacterium]|nr:hypothetical protein [Myxococcales bacterium]
MMPTRALFTVTALSLAGCAASPEIGAAPQAVTSERYDTTATIQATLEDLGSASLLDTTPHHPVVALSDEQVVVIMDDMGRRLVAPRPEGGIWERDDATVNAFVADVDAHLPEIRDRYGAGLSETDRLCVSCPDYGLTPAQHDAAVLDLIDEIYFEDLVPEIELGIRLEGLFEYSDPMTEHAGLMAFLDYVPYLMMVQGEPTTAQLTADINLVYYPVEAGDIKSGELWWDEPGANDCKIYDTDLNNNGVPQGEDPDDNGDGIPDQNQTQEERDTTPSGEKRKNCGIIIMREPPPFWFLPGLTGTEADQPYVVDHLARFMFQDASRFLGSQAAVDLRQAFFRGEITRAQLVTQLQSAYALQMPHPDFAAVTFY